MIEQEREKHLKELMARLEREEKLRTTSDEMGLQKQLMVHSIHLG